jgi:ATP-binding protein involved in chromosome partitioning
MTLTEEEVFDRLRNVEDPELGENIVSLEMVKNINVDDVEDIITVQLDLPNPAMEDDLRDAVSTALQDAEADVEVDWVTPDEDEGSEMLPNVDKVIAVSSGKGGVGKSTVAANLACALGREYSVGVLDADVYGPNLPRMFGDAEPPRVTKDEEIIPASKYGVRVMSMGYVAGDDSPVVWRGAMVHKALTQLLDDVRWGDLDYLVVDLPPGTGDAQLTIAQTVPVTGAVVVTTPQEVSVDDSRKGVKMFEKSDVDVAGIIENMAGFVCPDCGEVHDVFGEGGGEELAEESGVPLLGSVPLDPSVRTASDEGEPIVMGDESPARDALLETAEATREAVDDLAKKELPML